MGCIVGSFVGVDVVLGAEVGDFVAADGDLVAVAGVVVVVVGVVVGLVVELERRVGFTAQPRL